MSEALTDPQENEIRIGRALNTIDITIDFLIDVLLIEVLLIEVLGRCPMVATALGLVLFPAMMAFAASSDLLTMTISNRVSLILIGGFFLFALVIGMSGNAMLWHIGAGGMVLAVAFGCFAMGWIGGGDAKLAAATALWFGFDHLVPYLFYASLFGGALTLLLLSFRTLPLPQYLAAQQWVQRLHDKKGGVPYGIALAAAALLVYPDTLWMQAVPA